MKYTHVYIKYYGVMGHWSSIVPKKNIGVLQSQEFKQGLAGVLDNDSFFSND